MPPADRPLRPDDATTAADDAAVAAFSAVVRTHYAALAGVAHRLVRSQAIAEELVQEVLLATWVRRDALGDDPLEAYLFRGVRNRALNHLRGERVRARWETQELAVHGGLEPWVPASADAAVVEGEQGAAVRAAVDALPPRMREVFLLSRERGLSYAEIAETLAVSIKTVETQMGRALRTLRARLATLRD